MRGIHPRQKCFCFGRVRCAPFALEGGEVRYLIIPIGFIVSLAVVPCWAVQPYEPVHPDPVEP